MCSAAGCKYFDVDSRSFAAGLQMDEVVVLSRTTNTVRAVEMQSGVEKYVFSVLSLRVHFKCFCSIAAYPRGTSLDVA